MSLIKPSYNSYKNGLGTKFEKVDNKVLKMMRENPEGFRIKGKKEMLAKYSIDNNSYVKSFDRIQKANLNKDLKKFVFPSRNELIKNKKEKRNQDLLKKIKIFNKKDEAIVASGLSKSHFNRVLREQGIKTEDLNLEVGKRGTPDTSEKKTNILNNYLKKNVKRNFTRGQLADAVGMPRSYVKDKRIFQTNLPNLVTYKELKGNEFDKKIDEMNILIKDIKVGKVKPNMGEMYYKKMGYRLPDKLTKNYLEFPEKGNTSKLIVKKTKLSLLIGKSKK